MSTDDPAKPKPWTERPLWEIRACRDLFWLLLLAGTLWLVYELRALLVPILIAFALAYVVDPIVYLARRYWGVHRFVSALVLFLLVLSGALAFVGWLLPQFIEQSAKLIERAPAYYDVLAERYDLPQTENGVVQLSTRASTQPIDPQEALRSLLQGTGRLFGFIGDFIGTTTYLLGAGVLTLVLFLFFTTKLDRVVGIKQFLPASRRDQIWELLLKVDQAFSGYVRGQFIVALFTTTGFCIGFSLIDVPYWFVVSLVGGVLSLIPYGQVSGPISAILLNYLETQADETVAFTWMGVVLAPLIVYTITQSMESWVITPLVQSGVTRLHPVTVVVVLIIGGSVAGILGLILAVPLTASARMLYHELVEPRLKEWVESH